MTKPKNHNFENSSTASRPAAGKPGPQHACEGVRTGPRQLVPGPSAHPFCTPMSGCPPDPEKLRW